MRHLLLFSLIISTLFTFIACDKEEEDNKKTGTTQEIHGAAEIGPFADKSTVSLRMLDKDLHPVPISGIENFQVTISTTKHTYSHVNNGLLDTGILELTAKGYFFNANIGKTSSQEVTLKSIADLSGNSETQNINTLTQLTYERTRTLVSFGKSLNEAQKQATQEVLKCFSITQATSLPSQISLEANNEDSKILFAVSSIIMEGVNNKLLFLFFKAFDEDFAPDGKLDSEDLLETIHLGQKELNTAKVENSMNLFYEEQSSKTYFSEIWKYVDRNNDGSLDEMDAPDKLVEQSIFDKEEDCQRFLVGGLLESARQFMQEEIVWEANFCNIIEINEPTFNRLQSPTDPQVYSIWRNAYKGIRMCNELIYQLTHRKVNYSTDRYVASAYVYRAWLYLGLTQLFGDVPYITPEDSKDTNSTSYLKRKPVAEIRDNIYQQLMIHSKYLPETSITIYDGYQYPTHTLAQALIGEMLLEKKQYAAAQEIVDGMFKNLQAQESVFAFGKAINETPYLYTQYINAEDNHMIHDYYSIALMASEAAFCNNNLSMATAMLQKVNKNFVGEKTADEVKKELIKQKGIVSGKKWGYLSFLKRMDLAKDMLQVEAFRLLLPIPYSETQLSDLPQNPGY